MSTHTSTDHPKFTFGRLLAVGLAGVLAAALSATAP
jgi:hypothetical protein